MRIKWVLISPCILRWSVSSPAVFTNNVRIFPDDGPDILDLPMASIVTSVVEDSSLAHPEVAQIEGVVAMPLNRGSKSNLFRLLRRTILFMC